MEPLCTFNTGIEYGHIDISSAINDELKQITDWLDLNKLSLNAKKTKMMLFHHHQKNITGLIPKLRINNIPIERVKEFNFLGIVLDEGLTWKSHVQKVCSKIACVVGTINRLKNFLPRPILRMIYNALIQPHINYGILLWGHTNSRVIKLQKWAVRAITGSKYNAHCDPLFKQLSILKVWDTHKLNAIKFFHKYKNNALPASFCNILVAPITPTHPQNTRYRNEPRYPVPNTVHSESTVRYYIPDLIKSLPKCITDKVTTHSLKGIALYIKNYFISSYKDTCTNQNCYVCNMNESS